MKADASKRRWFGERNQINIRIKKGGGAIAGERIHETIVGGNSSKKRHRPVQVHRKRNFKVIALKEMEQSGGKVGSKKIHCHALRNVRN